MRFSRHGRRKARRRVALAVTLAAGLLVGAPAVSVAQGDFASQLLESAKDAYREGRFAEAARELRLAAFAVLDRPARYSEVLARLALAQEAGGTRREAQTTLDRFLEVEGTFRSYSPEALEPDVRERFHRLLMERIPRERLLAVPSLAADLGLVPRTATPAATQAAPEAGPAGQAPAPPGATPAATAAPALIPPTRPPTAVPPTPIPATRVPPTATRTATPVPPTRTATSTPPPPTETRTPTPVPPTRTTTPTRTAPPPTATRTATPSRRPLPPTETRTPTPVPLSPTATRTRTAAPTRTPTATRTATAAPTAIPIPPTATPIPPSPTRAAIPPAEANRPPRPIESPMPVYPEEALKNRIRGNVVLRVLVSESGEPSDIRVVHGARGGLTEAAVAAVRRWRFDPARKSGKPVPAYYTVRVPFEAIPFATPTPRPE